MPVNSATNDVWSGVSVIFWAAVAVGLEPFMTSIEPGTVHLTVAEPWAEALNPPRTTSNSGRNDSKSFFIIKILRIVCNFWIDKNIGPMPEHVARRHRFRQRVDNWYDILLYGNLHGSRGCTCDIYARGEAVEVETINAGSNSHAASIKYLDSSVSNHRIA